MMMRTAVTSSNIAFVGWEAETLFIKFNNGKIYSYADVPLETYNALIEAPSVGKAFFALVKPAFVATPLNEDPFTVTTTVS